MNKIPPTRLVYSTEQGRLCPHCQQPVKACRCEKKRALPAGDGIIRIHLETKGRKGKGVTVIAGIPLADEALEQLGKQLKQRCGTGGTVKDGTIEIQGDHIEKLSMELKAKGFTVKRKGG
ncbi:MAG: translation initiation factor Sui1 [Methylococcaceae bacterium]|jgi:translation initiation factor 1